MRGFGMLIICLCFLIRFLRESSLVFFFASYFYFYTGMGCRVHFMEIIL